MTDEEKQAAMDKAFERNVPNGFEKVSNELSSVKKVIGVMSGKGGVGKSFVTSMMASISNKKGLKTGIMDADIRIVFFKGLGGVRIYLKDKKLIRKKGKNAFDKYMDSLEIHAYCTAAVRDALTAQAQEEDPVTLSFDTDAE